MKRGRNPHQTRFQLPLGIRPWQQEARRFAMLAREGFLYEPLENSGDSFRITAMADFAKIEGIFAGFARQCLQEEGFWILEYYPDQPPKSDQESPAPTVFYSPYLPIGELLETIRPFWERFIHDGFVGFGLANNRLGMELFYSEEKVLTCFTGNHLRVMDLLSGHGLRHRQQLFMPTDFGHDHLSLQCHQRHHLPETLAAFSDRELDYTVFCNELVEQLEMYQVEESLSFFLSKKDQDLVEQRLLQHEEFAPFAEEDFGSLILDWNDFVEECEQRFDGDLFDYQQGLMLRDMLQFVMEGVPTPLKTKLEGILEEPDRRFRESLVDRRKRLDWPADPALSAERFWYQGVCRNQGSYLRRDLIRHGWYHP